jgi:hypothetical protein
MEQREYPRIQIPLLVELTHPAIGTIQTTARDISEGGIFVRMPDSPIKVGGKLKLRLMTILPTDTQATPTVEMQVKRATDEGLGLAFTTKTAEHLWGSVQRLRNELEIGRDYFQVHQSIAAIHPDRGLLLVQQNGKWLLPGCYLLVGDNPTKAITHFAKSILGVALSGKLRTHAADGFEDISVAEAATYSVIFTSMVEATEISLAEGCGYKDWRWLAKARDLPEITFASAWQRLEVEQILQQLADTRAQT